MCVLPMDFVVGRGTPSFSKIIHVHNIKKIKIQNHEKLTTPNFMKEHEF
jgi:hypothetical protein